MPGNEALGVSGTDRIDSQPRSAIIRRMPTLRTLRRLAPLVLAWFALFIGASIASPIIKPPAAQMICSAGGIMKLLAAGDDTPDAKASAGMDCPLCASIAHAGPAHRYGVEPPPSLSHALRPVVAARLAWLTRSPLPPRGPPLFS